MEIQELKTYVSNPADPEQFLTIENEYYEQIRFGNLYECKQLADYIAEVLQLYGESMQRKSPEMYDKLQTFWHRLTFKCFLTLQSPEKSDLLQKRLYYAITKGFEPDELLGRYFDFFGDKDILRGIFAPFI